MCIITCKTDHQSKFDAERRKEGEVPLSQPDPVTTCLWKCRFPGASPDPRINLSFKKIPKWFWGVAESETPVSGLGCSPAPVPPRIPFFLTYHLSAKPWASAQYPTSLQCCFLESGGRQRESCLRPSLPSALGLESCCRQPRPPWVDSCPPSARPCFPRDSTV